MDTFGIYYWRPADGSGRLGGFDYNHSIRRQSLSGPHATTSTHGCHRLLQQIRYIYIYITHNQVIDRNPQRPNLTHHWPVFHSQRVEFLPSPSHFHFPNPTCQLRQHLPGQSSHPPWKHQPGTPSCLSRSGFRGFQGQ